MEAERIAEAAAVPSSACQDMHDIETMGAEELRHQLRMQTDEFVKVENRTARMERILRKALKRRSDGG
ncbi:unnamed protein product [marine sediment metagenome]|uniref:Uncharacterized protein n=1 Tax=marine sediment metagenome TaxID=412755 RepID=X0XJ55_9ZZZZ